MKYSKQEKRKKIHYRIRSKVSGTVDRPRLSIYKSNAVFYAQIIDDEKGHTLASTDSRKFKGCGVVQVIKTAEDLVSKAKKKKITQVVFDRSGYIYQGRVKAFSETVRNNGIKH